MAVSPDVAVRTVQSNTDMHMFKVYGSTVYAVHAILGMASRTGCNDK